MRSSAIGPTVDLSDPTWEHRGEVVIYSYKDDDNKGVQRVVINNDEDIIQSEIME